MKAHTNDHDTAGWFGRRMQAEAPRDRGFRGFALHLLVQHLLASGFLGSEVEMASAEDGDKAIAPQRHSGRTRIEHE